MKDCRAVQVLELLRIEAREERQTPLIAKHPVFPAAVVRLIPPPWKVEVAVVEA